MKLHAWVDIVCETFISKQIYDAVDLVSQGFSATFLKFIEEEGVADGYDGSYEVSCFWNVLPEGLALAGRESVRPSWLLWAPRRRF